MAYVCGRRGVMALGGRGVGGVKRVLPAPLPLNTCHRGGAMANGGRGGSGRGSVFGGSSALGRRWCSVHVSSGVIGSRSGGGGSGMVGSCGGSGIFGSRASSRDISSRGSSGIFGSRGGRGVWPIRCVGSDALYSDSSCTDSVPPTQVWTEQEPGVWRLERPPPHLCERGDPGDLPFLIDSPHSGTDYPDSFQAALGLDMLRQTEDSYVDQLWSGSPTAAGATLLSALFPRSFIDPNRPPDDIDPSLVDDSRGPLLLPMRPGPKTKLGVGLIRRVAVPGYPIYDRQLTTAEVLHRIKLYYEPYHAKLASELDAMQARWGQVFLLDAHSMKSVGNAATPDGPGSKRPDVVVGDLEGLSCAPWLTDCVVEALRDRQYSVKVNQPYKGGYITKRHGAPKHGRHAVQVEVNRALYMDEATRVPHAEGFRRLQSDLQLVAAEVATAIREELSRTSIIGGV